MDTPQFACIDWIRSSALAITVLLAVPPVLAEQSDSKPESTDQLEQLVAPIALYPDSLLAQILMASTYPLEIVEAARWVKSQPDLKGKALEDALQKESWDPSVKSLTAFPQVLAMMNDKLDWTTQLGDAFLAQQKSVMNSVQVLREKAKAEGNLESNEKQTVKVEPTPTGTQTQTIIIQPANPQVVYVPTYNPTVIYGPWPYPAYRPFYWYPPGYVAASSMISFGIGFTVGAAMWGGCNWGHSNVDININRYNSFNRTNIHNVSWKHNSAHRKGVPYGNKGLQNRYAGNSARDAKAREAFRGHAEKGRQQIAGGAADRFKGAKPQGAFQGKNRPVGAGKRAGDFGTKDRQFGQAGAAARRSKPGGSAFSGMGNAREARRDSFRGANSRMGGSRRAGGFGGGGGGRHRFGGGGRRR